MNQLRIALAQVEQTADFERNCQRVFDFLDQASAQGAQIVCFPEAQTVGYRADIVAANAPVPVEELKKLHSQVGQRCRELGVACVLGTETPKPDDPVGGKPFNSALVFSERGEVLLTHHKTKLTPLDAIAYSAGDTFESCELFGIKVGVVICFEGFRFAETTRECVRQGAQLVFHPQNNTTRPNDWTIPIHDAMVTTRAAENTIWFASCNTCLEHQNAHTMVIAPDGRVHAQAEIKREELLVVDLDVDRATHAMFNFDVEGCAELLFADTVRKEEFQSAVPKK